MCAIPPGLRRPWADHCARLLRSGGRLAGFFYLGETRDDGPPFAIPASELGSLLYESFERLEDRPSASALPVFGDAERWQVWRRRDDD